MMKGNSFRRLPLCFVAVFSFLGWSTLGQAQDATRAPIYVVIGDDSDTTKRIVDDLRIQIPSGQVINDLGKIRTESRASIYIAVGPTALRGLLSKHVDGVVVSAFVSSHAYRLILNGVPTERRPMAITAVYAEPSPTIQMRLISMVFKRPVRIATLLSEQTLNTAPLLQRAASQDRHSLSVETVEAGDSLNRALNRVSDYPVILATPDSTIFNAENLRTILINTYRANQAVIGFSTAMVKAGALATTYSDIEDIDAHVAEIINDFEKFGKLAEPQFPKYFSTRVNSNVAHSLNIVVDESVSDFARKPAPREKR